MIQTRRALLYCAAFGPYAASYFLLFHSSCSVSVAVLQTAYNILPAMLLGLAVLRWTRIVPLALHTRKWFHPLQMAAAFAYSTLWYIGVVVLSSVGNAVHTGHFRLGNFSQYATQWQFFSGLMIYSIIVGVAFISQANRTIREEEHRRCLAETLQTKSELAVLRAQLNPHFLFNTLNSLVALVALDKRRAADAIMQLSDMLRYTLREHRNFLDGDVSLGEELAFTEQYLALEALRLGDRLAIERRISPDALAWRMPALTVQPLVENAIRHGIAPRAGLGTLSLSATLCGDALHLCVSDDGRGADPEEVIAATGLGVRTVRQRLNLFSGGKTEFVVEGSRGNGLSISIRLPRPESEDGPTTAGRARRSTE